ncbi:hypothetical protein BH20ACT5_BH20ACT5_12100 [soil metagenome]
MTTGRLQELLPPDTHLAFAAMRELRPDWSDESVFVQQVDEVQRSAGYRIVGVFGTPRHALAVAGFHAGSNLAWGRHIYLADLSTVAGERGHGHAGRLLDWLSDEAGRLGCGQIHLDSGVGADRTAAHRLYFNAGYRISSHHFTRTRSGGGDPGEGTPSD